jgi:hypothetical protein
MKGSKSPARQEGGNRGPELQLVLAIERQAEGEPDHWALVVANEGGSGDVEDVYQVRGKKVIVDLPPNERSTLHEKRTLIQFVWLGPQDLVPPAFEKY